MYDSSRYNSFLDKFLKRKWIFKEYDVSLKGIWFQQWDLGKKTKQPPNKTCRKQIVYLKVIVELEQSERSVSNDELMD